MKKILLITVVLISILAMAGFVWAYGEGPSQSGKWVEGHVKYGDGSKCGKCCSISIETENGFSKEGCTDDNGNYKIYISSDYIKAVYFRGSKVWSGSEESQGGATINILAK